LNIAEFGCVNPIMGTLWALACQTLVQEVTRIRSSSNTWSSPHSSGSSHQTHLQPSQEEESLLASLRQGLSTLTFFSTNSALMSKSSIFPLRGIRCLLRDWRWVDDVDANLEAEDLHGNNHTQGSDGSVTPLSSWTGIETPPVPMLAYDAGRNGSWDPLSPHEFVSKSEYFEPRSSFNDFPESTTVLQSCVGEAFQNHRYQKNHLYNLEHTAQYASPV